MPRAGDGQWRCPPPSCLVRRRPRRAGGKTVGFAVSGEGLGSYASRGEEHKYRGCAADGRMVREAGWVSRRAPVDAVAKTSPFSLKPGVWTSTRPPMLSRRRAMAAGHASTGTWTWEWRSLGHRKINNSPSQMPLISRAGLMRDSNDGHASCKGRASESTSQRAPNIRLAHKIQVRDQARRAGVGCSIPPESIRTFRQAASW